MDRGEGVQGGAGRSKSLRDGRGEGSGAGGRPRDRGGATQGKAGSAMAVWEKKNTMVSTDSRRGRQIEDPSGGTQEDGAGGKYCVGGTDMEESASNIAQWIEDDTE